MNIAELYHSRVRDLISQKYREVSEERQRLLYREHMLLNSRDPNTMPYNEYIAMSNEIDSIKQEIRYLDIAINTWDEARELCFEAAEDFKD